MFWGAKSGPRKVDNEVSLQRFAQTEEPNWGARNFFGLRWRLVCPEVLIYVRVCLGMEHVLEGRLMPGFELVYFVSDFAPESSRSVWCQN